MVTVIAVANQKGGVGKTTSAVNLSAESALSGVPTLLMDLDPQGSASSGLRVEGLNESDLYDVFLGQASLSDLVTPTEISGLSCVGASKDLVSLEIEIGKVAGKETLIRDELSKLGEDFAFAFLDCPPSSGLLTLNALAAADFVIVPLQAEYYALEGISSLMETVQFVQHTINPMLRLLGVFMTMVDARTNLSAQVESEARDFFGSVMFDTKIPRSVRLSESPSHGKPISLYDPSSAGAKAYRVLSMEIAERIVAEGETPQKREMVVGES